MKKSTLQTLGLCSGALLLLSFLIHTFKGILRFAGFAALLLCSASILRDKLK